MSLWACSGTHFSGRESSQHPSLLVLITHNKRHRCFLIRWSQRGSHYQLWRKKRREGESGRAFISEREDSSCIQRKWVQYTDSKSVPKWVGTRSVVLRVFVQGRTRGNTFLGDHLRAVIDLHHIFIWFKCHIADPESVWKPKGTIQPLCNLFWRYVPFMFDN